MKKIVHLYFCFLGVVTGVAFTIHSALADDHEIEEVVVVGEIVGELGLARRQLRVGHQRGLFGAQLRAVQLTARYASR